MEMQNTKTKAYIYRPPREKISFKIFIKETLHLRFYTVQSWLPQPQDPDSYTGPFGLVSALKSGAGADGGAGAGWGNWGNSADTRLDWL